MGRDTSQADSPLRSPLRVAFAGGGSGGHINAGVAVAEELQRRDAASRFLFLTSDRDVDQRILNTAGLPGDHPRVPLPVRPLRSFARHPVQALTALRQSLRISRQALMRFRPDVVVGLGGYTSVPAVCAARRAGLPIVLLESNSVPGRANRLLARIADVVCTGLPLAGSFPAISRRCRSTGVPVRRRFQVPVATASPAAVSSQTDADAPDDTLSQQRTILVLGGSQGAQRVNELVVNALGDLPQRVPGWRIVHQTGPGDHARMVNRWGAGTASVCVVPLIEDPQEEMQQAGLAISRAGAVTLAELACTGTPMVLIPLRSATDGHQTANAESCVAAGAATLVDDGSPQAAAELRAIVERLINDVPQRCRMAASARRMARPEAAIRIADTIREVIRKGDSEEFRSCIRRWDRAESGPKERIAADPTRLSDPRLT